MFPSHALIFFFFLSVLAAFLVLCQFLSQGFMSSALKTILIAGSVKLPGMLHTECPPIQWSTVLKVPFMAYAFGRICLDKVTSFLWELVTTINLYSVTLTNLPLSIRPEVDTRPKPNNRDSVQEVEKGTEIRDSQWRSYKPKSILEIILLVLDLPHTGRSQKKKKMVQEKMKQKKKKCD